MLTGGTAAEFWTGGTGQRPALTDLDVVLPIRTDGQEAHVPPWIPGITSANKYDTPFHAYANGITTMLERDHGSAKRFAVEDRYCITLPHGVVVDFVAAGVGGGSTFFDGMSQIRTLQAGAGDVARTAVMRVSSPASIVQNKVGAKA